MMSLLSMYAHVGVKTEDYPFDMWLHRVGMADLAADLDRLRAEHIAQRKYRASRRRGSKKDPLVAMKSAAESRQNKFVNLLKLKVVAFKRLGPRAWKHHGIKKERELLTLQQYINQLGTPVDVRNSLSSTLC